MKVSELVDSLDAYFQANPYEFLTTGDVCTKYGVSVNQVCEALKKLSREGTMVRRESVILLAPRPPELHIPRINPILQNRSAW